MSHAFGTAGVTDYRTRARALTPTIAGLAGRIDAERELPQELVDALHDAALYRMLIPREYGGGECDPRTFVETLEIVAAADASTAWCLGQGGGCAMAAAYLEPAVAHEIFGSRDAVVAWGPPQSGVTPRAERVEGGYRLSGTWEFASGSRHATWLGAAAPISPSGDGRAASAVFLFPRPAATITDTWQVLGLRGTGSDRYAVDALVVARDHTFEMEVERCRIARPLYRFSVRNMYALGFAGIALGIARATFDDLLVLAQTKRGARSGAALRESPAVQGEIGLTEAKLRGARASLYASLDGAWEHAQTGSGPLPTEDRIAMRAASTFAIQTAKEVVQSAYQLAGTNAIFESQPFERRFRDIHAVTQQIQGHVTNFQIVGRHRLGLPPGLNI
jgi:alkylation response protein AidB-like acyl-CoA dehydrogenase